jgi:hypothetical protein
MMQAPTSSRSRPVCVHFHVFKNAGTTLDGALRREFGVGWAEFDGPRANYVLQAEEMRAFVETRPALSAVSSHQVRFPLPAIYDVAWRPLLLVRHPLDRALSAYKFHRRARTRSAASLRAKRTDLRGYLRWTLDRSEVNLVSNFQTAFFSTDAGSRRQPALGAATARLREAALAGTVERFGETLTCAERTLAADFPALDLSCAARNVSGTRRERLDERLAELRERAGADLYAELERRNDLDFALHEEAARELDGRLLRLFGDRATAAFEDFRARCAAREAVGAR